MKKRFYIRPMTKIIELKTRTILMTSGLSANRKGYGKASIEDGTEQTWE